jgi:dipeptidyl-peptidase 4
VSWGSADFIAAEEMGRSRGYWWSPDGTVIAACRVDDAEVDQWVIADPAHPEQPARTIRYPAAGTTNPDVTLHLLGLDGSRTAVEWDRDLLPLPGRRRLDRGGLTLLVQSRDQQGTMVLDVDTTPGSDTRRDHRAVARLRRRLGRARAGDAAASPTGGW